MSTKIFVNLPVRDLAASIDFFTRTGFSFDPRFTAESAGCMVISDDIYAMLLTEPHFKEVTGRQIVDATTSTEAVMCLGVESRARVDELADAALAAGGTAAGEPQDEGFMYGRGFHDLDGHQWEVMHMDMSAIPG